MGSNNEFQEKKKKIDEKKKFKIIYIVHMFIPLYGFTIMVFNLLSVF